MTYAIETSALTKEFGPTKALGGIDLRIRKGSVYGLLGPNGAGKTTAIRVLATLLKPTSGTAHVMGLDVVREAKAVRQKVSLTGQYASVDEELTGHENLVLVGRLLGLPWRDAKDRATELLSAFGLDDAAKRLVRTYSGGMRRRIDIAASLVVTPDVLFLDEPTTGLDPRSRNQVWDIVRRIAGMGTTVLLTTQYLEEADRLAERMAVIDHGLLIAEGTSRDLKASVGANALHVRVGRADQLELARSVVVKVLGSGPLPGTDPGVLSVKVGDQRQAAAVMDALSRQGVTVQEFSLGTPSLDDVFFALTGRPAEANGANGANGASGAKGPGDGHDPRDARPRTASIPSAGTPADTGATGGHGAAPRDAGSEHPAGPAARGPPAPAQGRAAPTALVRTFRPTGPDGAGVKPAQPRGSAGAKATGRAPPASGDAPARARKGGR